MKRLHNRLRVHPLEPQHGAVAAILMSYAVSCLVDWLAVRVLRSIDDLSVLVQPNSTSAHAKVGPVNRVFVQKFSQPKWRFVQHFSQAKWRFVQHFSQAKWRFVQHFSQAKWRSVQEFVQSKWMVVQDFVQNKWRSIEPPAEIGWESLQRVVEQFWRRTQRPVERECESIWCFVQREQKLIPRFERGQKLIPCSPQGALSSIPRSAEGLWRSIQRPVQSLWSRSQAPAVEASQEVREKGVAEPAHADRGFGDRVRESQSRCEWSRSYSSDPTGEEAVPCGSSADFVCESCGFLCLFCLGRAHSSCESASESTRLSNHRVESVRICRASPAVIT